MRDTEIHFTGETTLDNGLTVGVHAEAMADAGDSFRVDESYAYFSGNWGRVNFGDEDGAAYLLQVTAPSADSNVDGIRQYVNPVNYNAAPGLVGLASNFINNGGNLALNALVFDLDGSGGASAGDVLAGSSFSTGLFADLFKMDYAQDATRHADKLTYLTPVFSGFQAGVSYTPQAQANSKNDVASRSFGNSLKNGSADGIGSAWELAGRWEGKFNDVGLNLGGGWTHLNDTTNGGSLLYIDTNGNGVHNAGEATLGDRQGRDQWNLGADVNFAAFGVGLVYTHDDMGFKGNFARRVWDGGVDYTTGPFKLGASYMNLRQELGVSDDRAKTQRYSGGVVYSFAPGMSFRGSVGMVRTRVDQADDVDATYGLLGENSPLKCNCAKVQLYEQTQRIQSFKSSRS
ncbi:MAG: porin [Methylocella sp.]